MPSSTDRPRRRDRRRRWPALLCGLVLTACGPAATSTGAGSPDAAAPSLPASAQAAEPSGLDGAALSSVAQIDGATAAVGSDGDGAAAWTSQDGVTWEPADVAEAASVPALRAVAFADRGVAFGGDDIEESRLWTSVDGTTWEPAGEGVGEALGGRVNAVAPDGAGWAAVGDRVDPEGGEAAGGVLWTSPDGTSWEVAAELPLDEGTISDVVVTDDGMIVAGFDVAGGRMWTVDDRGTPTAADGDFGATTIQGVAEVDGGYVAMGSGIGDLLPVLWTSEDGRAWTRHDLDPTVFAPEDEINDMTAVDGRVVAVGSGPDGAALWISDDGRAWERLF